MYLVVASQLNINPSQCYMISQFGGNKYCLNLLVEVNRALTSSQFTCGFPNTDVLCSNTDSDTNMFEIMCKSNVYYLGFACQEQLELDQLAKVRSNSRSHWFVKIKVVENRINILYVRTLEHLQPQLIYAFYEIC